MQKHVLIGLLVLLVGKASTASAQTYLDTIVFGNAASETSHAFVGTNTFIITNTAVSPAQTARLGSTNSPNVINGGSLTFTMAVDPAWRNYFTIKLWGSDDSSAVYEQDSDMGRLYLYIAASNYVAGMTTNYQIGYRHEGDYICLNAAAYKAPLPGRFFYSTTLLPLWMTQGRTNLTMTIQPTGRIYDLGSGGPPSGNYQFNMVTNSRSIYQAYTHTVLLLNPMGEVQGSAPATTILPSPTASIMTPGGTFYNGISNYLSGKLTQNVTNFTTTDVMQLAKAYSLTNFPVTHTNPAVVTQVINAIDAFATNYFANPSSAVTAGGNEGWGGRFGNLGWAIHLLLPQLQSSLGVTYNYGAGGTIARSLAWGEMLQGSRDYGRTNRDDWDLSNQGLIANTSIYWANRGMLDLTNANAFAETNAQRYLQEAIGITPWLGDDLPGGGSDYYHGTNYYQVTAKGLTREWGYVGTAYGEMQFYAADFYSWTTNPVFLAQAVKMVKARANFRRPSMLVSGSSYYQDMEGIGLLAWRGADESDTEFADEVAYGDRSSWALGMRVAAVTQDTNAIGYAKQMLSDNQFFNNLLANTSSYTTIGNQIDSRDALNAFADYLTVSNAPDSGVRLPMTSGQPDFAWSDEDDGIVAIKHNGERLWISAYWQAKDGTGVNGIGRFYDSTTNFDRYGVLETSPLINFSGEYYLRPNLMDKPEEDFYVPPDDPLQAYQGERLPLGASDPLAIDNQPFLGKALFWACRYGNYLIGINRNPGATYQLQTPDGFVSATNLITGQNMTGTVYVAPESTVVLYLNSATDPCPPPQPPLSLSAVGNATPQVSLNWNAASGATGYSVERANVSGGPYTVITNVASTNYTDSSVGRGITYYYVVASTNACGTSYYNSMEASASGGLPSPWLDVDIGTVGTAGGADYNNGTFTVSGAGADFGGTADACNFAYMSMTNNGVIIANLSAEQFSGSGIDKVGVMMRDTTNSNSRVAALILDSQLGVPRLATRSSTGASMSWLNGSAITWPPQWLKLQNANDTFTAYVSSNGTSWTPVATNSISLNSIGFVGMVVCSRTTSQLNVSMFNNVSTPSWTPPPAAPLGLATTAGDAQVSLLWNAATNASGYVLSRSTIYGGDYTPVSSLGTTNYTDTNLVNGTTYYYVVTATNYAGMSADSVQATATPEAVEGTNVVWSGAVNGNWDTTTANWLQGSLAATYQDGAKVLFNDTALGNTSVIVSATVSPASLVVSNSQATYVFSGGAIAGSCGLIKLGSGLLALENVNAYTGNITIGAGTLALSGTGSISNSPNITIVAGAKLDVSGLAGTFTLNSNQALAAGGATATINGSVNFAAGVLAMTYSSGTPALTVTNGTLTLDNNPVTVTVTGTALPAGMYELVSAGAGGLVSGSVAGSTLTVNGAGLASLASPSLQILNGGLYLMVGATTTVLSSSINPVGYNGSVSFNASINTNGVPAGNAGGNVTFQTNGVALGTYAVGNGLASSPAVSTLPRGTNLITAIYSGDANYSGSTNTLNQVVTNHPPVAAIMTVDRTAGANLQIALTDVATNWSDVDGDTVTFAGLNPVSTNGVNISTNNGYILYTNSANVGDQISYAISDGQGGTNTGLINIMMNPFLPGQYTTLASADGTVTLSFEVIPGYSYGVQRSTNLLGSWETLETTNAPASGGFSFQDTFPDLGGNQPSSAYYRLQWNP